MVEKLVGELFDRMARTLDASKYLGCGETLKNIFFAAMKFNDYDRLRVYRRLPFIEKEDLRDCCIGNMREKEVAFIGRLVEVIREGIQAGEINEVVEDGIIALFMSMLQGNLDGKLLYINHANVDAFYEKSCECYWNGIKGKK